MQKNKLLRKLAKVLLSLIVAVTSFLIVGQLVSYAGENQSMRGWMWGGGAGTIGSNNHTNVGWISTNSQNCDANGDGLSDGTVNCPAAGTAIADYGVHVPRVGDTVDSIIGHAWSENIGWVSFEPHDLIGCPVVVEPHYKNKCKAWRDNEEFHGWARIVAIKDELAVGNSGGWQGWIKLSGTNYGVTATGDLVDIGGVLHQQLEGYAWSDELGWIDFSNTAIKLQKYLKICENECKVCTTAGCDEVTAISPLATDSAMNAVYHGLVKYSKKVFKACYSPYDTCKIYPPSGDKDVTADATWSEEDDEGLPSSYVVSGKDEPSTSFLITDYSKAELYGTRGVGVYPNNTAHNPVTEAEKLTVEWIDENSEKRNVEVRIHTKGIAGVCANTGNKTTCIPPSTETELKNVCNKHNRWDDPPTMTKVGTPPNETYEWNCLGDDASDSPKCTIKRRCEYIEVGL